MSNFLAAHKDVGTILFNQMAFESTPVLNTVNRYSGKKDIRALSSICKCKYDIIRKILK